MTETPNPYLVDTDTLTELNSRNSEAGGIVLDAGETFELPDGKGSITFEVTEAGTFTYFCSIPGHRQIGMEGTFEATGPASISQFCPSLAAI